MAAPNNRSSFFPSTRADSRASGGQAGPPAGIGFDATHPPVPVRRSPPRTRPNPPESTTRLRVREWSSQGMPCRRPRHRRTTGTASQPTGRSFPGRGGPPGPTARLLRPAGPPFLGRAARPLSRAKARAGQPTESPRRFAEAPVSAQAGPPALLSMPPVRPSRADRRHRPAPTGRNRPTASGPACPQLARTDHQAAVPHRTALTIPSTDRTEATPAPPRPPGNLEDMGKFCDQHR